MGFTVQIVVGPPKKTQPDFEKKMSEREFGSLSQTLNVVSAYLFGSHRPKKWDDNEASYGPLLLPKVGVKKVPKTISLRLSSEESGMNGTCISWCGHSSPANIERRSKKTLLWAQRQRLILGLATRKLCLLNHLPSLGLSFRRLCQKYPLKTRAW